MKVSIIVPVYQVERYLRACIESVLCQTHREWELILVEDGSPDRCGVICDEYAKNDARITVMHKENGGLSSARNAGLCRATGEYILFLDGDDFWAEPEGLARLIPQLTSDVVVFGFSKWYEPNGAERGRWIGPDIAEGCPVSGREAQLGYLLQKGCYTACAWNKAVRRELFSSCDLRFREGVTSEDIDWCARLALAAKSFGLSACRFYRYRQRTGSITRTMNLKSLRDLKENIELCLRLPQEMGASTAIKGLYWSYVAYQFGTFLVCAPSVNGPEGRGLVQEMREKRWLLRYNAASRKVQLLYVVDRLLGYRALCLLCRGYAAIRK